MNRDFRNTQRRSPSASTDGVPQPDPAVTVSAWRICQDLDSRANGSQDPNDEVFLAQLAAISGLLQLPVGENSFHAPDLLTESYAQQHLQSLTSQLHGQPIPGPSSQQILPPFPSALHWPQYQDLFNNLPSTSAVGSSQSSSTMDSPGASPSASIIAEPDAVDATAEEKRRRNTAASARFRIKKKLRAVNLERSVSDLTGHADELEREAADLRRENSWLKEIVMLKGTRLAALNLTQHLQAMNQSLVNEMQVQQTRRRTLSFESRHEEESDEDEEDEAEGASDKKGKGKSKRGP